MRQLVISVHVATQLPSVLDVFAPMIYLALFALPVERSSLI